MRFCNGIPNDRYRIVADENRWQVGYASPFRDGRGGNVFRPGAAAHAWRPSPSPQPPSSPPLGARKGEGAAFPSPSPLHRFARRSACSFLPLPYTDDLIDERSVAWGDR